MQNIFNILRKILHIILPTNILGDKIYSIINFIINHKRLPSKKMLFNDYMYRLKTSNEIINPLRVFVTDKINLKKFVKKEIGNKYNVPTIKIFDTFNQINKYKFPHRCIIKPTHLSGEVIIKSDRAKINYNKIKKWFETNYYDRARERNYKNLRPKVIIEPILFNNANISDYKFFCYKGSVNILQIDHDRFKNRSKSFYKLNLKKKKYSWKKQHFYNYKLSKKILQKPKNLNQMIKITKKLSKSFEFIRVDLYTNQEDIYVGELTSICGNASLKFYPKNSEKLFSQIVFSKTN